MSFSCSRGCLPSSQVLELLPATERSHVFFFLHSGTKWCKYGHTAIFTQGLPHATRMWCHYTMCTYRMPFTFTWISIITWRWTFGHQCWTTAGWRKPKNLIRERLVLPASSLADAGVRDEREMGSRTVRLEPTIYGLEVQRLVRGLELLVFSHALKQMVHNMWPEYGRVSNWTCVLLVLSS